MYPGDGIGIDVTQCAERVLDAVQREYGGFSFDREWFPWGCDYYDKHGMCAPEDMIDVLKQFDATFLGAVGFPSRVPDHLSLAPLIQMRQSFDLYACVRPCKTFAGVPHPLSDPKSHKIDMVVIRENSEGEYVNNGGRFAIGKPNELAVQTAVHSRHGVERILRYGFETALRRSRKKLTMITKSNAQRYGMVLWDDILEEVRPEYEAQGVQVDWQHVDAAAMNFVRMPQDFDVVVASNLFGDILTDLSGAITGSLGLNPSANLNPERKYPSLFEPVHGSAPDIAGKSLANPTAAFLSLAMMIDWLCVADTEGTPASRAIRNAVADLIAQGKCTIDVGGLMSTEQFCDAVVGHIAKTAAQ